MREVHSRRIPVGLVLGGQAAIMVLAFLLTGLWSHFDHKADQDLQTPRQRVIRDLMVSVNSAQNATNDFVVHADVVELRTFERALGSLKTGIVGLSRVAPAVAPLTIDLSKIVGQLEESGRKVYIGNDVDARYRAMKSFDSVAAKLAEALWEVEAALHAERDRAMMDRELLLFSVFGFALVIYLALGFLARRLYEGELISREVELEESIAEIGNALQAIREGKPLPGLSSHGLIQSLSEALTQSHDELIALREDGERQQRWSTFRHALESGMDLADSEPEVLRMAQLAISEAFPDAGFQMLMADNSDAELFPWFPEARRLCAPESPYRCPAMRRGRVEQVAPQPVFGSCPHTCCDGIDVTCVPLAVSGRAVGVVQLYGQTVDSEHLNLLQMIASSTGTRLSVVRTLDERALQAGTDVLTGLFNRRRLNEGLARLDRDGVTWAVISCDLDHFKTLNDTYGHEVGDRCLKVFSTVLMTCVREGDLVSRPGGEEFMVILPSADLAAAAEVAERIRRSTELASAQAGTAFTVSQGVAEAPRDGDESAGVLRMADLALYQAKRDGRNRVCLSSEVEDAEILELPEHHMHPIVADGESGTH